MVCRLLVLAAVGTCAACGSPIVPPAGKAELVALDASTDRPPADAGGEPVTVPDAGVGADAGSAGLEADAGADEVPGDPPAAADAEPAKVPDVHPVVELYRERVGAWMTGQERRRIERVDPSDTGLADGAALAELVQERALRGLLPSIFDRVGSKQLRADARQLRKSPSILGGGYEEESSDDVILNYTLVDFESTECYESDLRGRRRTRDYSLRCSIAFGAARLLTKPLGADLRWPEFGSFGNCRGESGYNPEDEMPCFTSGSEGGSLPVLFDLALEVGVPRSKVVAFATKTFELLVSEAAEQTRIAQIEFTPVGSRRLSSIVFDLKRWMTAAEWQRFDKATGIGSAVRPTQRAEDARRLARALGLPLVDDVKLLPFSGIYSRIDEHQLLDDGEYLQCPQQPEARFNRCIAATEATSTFLAITDYWGEDDDGDPAVPAEGFDGLTASMLDDLLAAGIPRKKLLRELTAAFRKALKSK
jgi:hypothetical protein